MKKQKYIVTHLQCCQPLLIIQELFLLLQQLLAGEQRLPGLLLVTQMDPTLGHPLVELVLEGWRVVVAQRQLYVSQGQPHLTQVVVAGRPVIAYNKNQTEWKAKVFTVTSLTYLRMSH